VKASPVNEIPATSAVDRAYEVIRARILSGDYAPGSSLRLVPIAKTVGASFIPVREALRRLAAEQFVELTPNKGARVARISVEDMSEIYEVRGVLEVHALRCAYPNLTTVHLDEAEGHLTEMTRLFRADDDLAYHHHRRVHFTLYEQAGSRWLDHVITLLWDNAERYLRQSPRLRPSLDEFAAEHRKILDAIRRGDLESAISLLEDHLQRTRNLLEARYARDAGRKRPSKATA
jgi:DNA-binding GntR family transcriptional regulator